MYRIREYDRPQTQKQIIEEARLLPRTVRYALDALIKADLVEKRRYLPDARQTLYEPTQETTPTQESADASCQRNGSAAGSDDNDFPAPK